MASWLCTCLCVDDPAAPFVFCCHCTVMSTSHELAHAVDEMIQGYGTTPPFLPCMDMLRQMGIAPDQLIDLLCP